MKWSNQYRQHKLGFTLCTTVFFVYLSFFSHHKTDQINLVQTSYWQLAVIYIETIRLRNLLILSLDTILHFTACTINAELSWVYIMKLGQDFFTFNFLSINIHCQITASYAVLSLSNTIILSQRYNELHLQKLTRNLQAMYPIGVIITKVESDYKYYKVHKPHKTMQCAYFCVHLSEAINGRSLIIEKQTIHTKYSATSGCV